MGALTYSSRVRTGTNTTSLISGAIRITSPDATKTIQIVQIQPLVASPVPIYCTNQSAKPEQCRPIAARRSEYRKVRLLSRSTERNHQSNNLRSDEQGPTTHTHPHPPTYGTERGKANHNNRARAGQTRQRIHHARLASPPHTTSGASHRQQLAEKSPLRNASLRPIPARAQQLHRPPQQPATMLLPLLSLSLLLLSSNSHPLPAAQALLSLSPTSLLTTLLPSLHPRSALPRSISQTLTPSHLHLLLPPLRTSHLHVRASLSQPSRTLHINLRPICTAAPCPPDISYSLRLAAPVDSSARVRVLLQNPPPAQSQAQVHIALPLLEPVLVREVAFCAEESACLAALVRSRCNGRLHVASMERCGPECVVERMRVCQGEGRGVGSGVQFVAGMFLAAASVGVVLVFVAGACLAVVALPAEVVVVVGRVAEMVAEKRGVV